MKTGPILLSCMIYLMGIILYQYTAIIWFLLIPASFLVIAVFVFIIAASALLSNYLEYKNEDSQQGNTGLRILNQLSIGAYAYQIALIGYSFLAGAITLYIAVMIMMIFFEKNKE